MPKDPSVFDRATRAKLNELFPGAARTLLLDLEEAVSTYRGFQQEWDFPRNRRRVFGGILRNSKALRRSVKPVAEFLPSLKCLRDFEDAALRLFEISVKSGPKRSAPYRRLVDDFCCALHAAGIPQARTRHGRVEEVFRLVYRKATETTNHSGLELRDDLMREMRRWPKVRRCSRAHCLTCAKVKNLRTRKTN